MKKEVKKEPVLMKAEDFPLQMPCQVKMEEYQHYAVWSSEEERKTVRTRTIATTIIFLISGALIIYRGLNSSWTYSDLLTILGVLLMGYGIIDVFYQFFLFKSVLRKHIAKEYKKEERYSREVTFCFAEDKVVSFWKGQHQSTYYYDEILSRKENEKLLLLTMKNGKILVWPQRVIKEASAEIQAIIAGLGKEA